MKNCMLYVVVLMVAFVENCADKPTVPEVLETTISGRVVDAESGKPIPNATVSSEPVTEQVLTNAEGVYVLRATVQVGKSYRVTATVTGYAQNSVEVTAREGENRIADLRLSPSTPKLQVSPDSLYFDSISNSRTLVIHNSGTGVLTWSVTAPSEPWLKVSPSSGKTGGQDGTMIITVDRSVIETNGVYSASVVITSDGGTFTIPIKVVVEGKTPISRLSVAPPSLGFGTTSNRKTVGISNTGSGELIWQASSPQPWITITPDSGTVASGSMQVVIEVNRSQLTPGEHTGSIDIVSNGGSVSIPITVSVPTPVLSLNTREIDFRTDLETFTLEVANVGTGDLNWEFKNEIPWLSINPFQGVTAQVATPVVLSVQRQGLDPGVYDVQVQLTSNSTSEPVVNLRVRMQVLKSPLLDVNPDTLDFGTEAEQISLEIANANNDTLIWQIEANESWLAIDRLSGEISRLSQASIKVNVQRRGLTAGTYQAQIAVNSNGGRKTVLVKMEVGHNPRLTTNAQTLDLGTSAVNGTIELRNTGTGRLTWNVQEEVEWLEVAPSSGTILNEVDQISITVNRTKLLAGSYTAVVTIASDGGEQQVLVEVVVSPQPVLSISADSIDFGMEVVTRTLSLSNQGNAPLVWNITKTDTWVQVTPSGGELGIV